ncbi:MAG: hypothetical protein WAS51_16465 [Ilumatobacteraceae bacterium]|nr:MAG: hypothetical protein IPM43_03030 [Actinomycetota bacterium]
MTLLDVTDISSTTRRTPTDLLLTGALVVAPLLYLTADAMYAVRGWDDADAAGVHVLGAIAYAFVLVRLASWATGWLAAATLFVGIVGACGNVAYGFNTIHVSLGAVDLVDTDGVGAIIKPLGLFCPAGFVLGAIVLARIGQRVPAWLVGVAGVAWPVAHIRNVGWLAILVNVCLVLGLVPLAFRRTDAPARAPR